MNTTFKHGQRVELIEDYGTKLPKGTQGTVDGNGYRSFDSKELVHVKYDTEPDYRNGTYTRRLKLVEAALKVGDTIESLREPWGRVLKGTRLIVTKVLSEDGVVEARVEGSQDSFGWYMGKNWYKKAAPAPAVTKAHEYKVGDRVQITIPEGDGDTFGGYFFVTGLGTVTDTQSGDTSMLHVLADTPHPRRNTHKAWNIDKKYVTPLVEEVLPFEVGSRVRAKKGFYGLGDEGIVTELNAPWGGDIKIAWEKGLNAGMNLGAMRSKLDVIASPVVERPKATPATETKPQIGDTIVAFFEKNGVETRKKGYHCQVRQRRDSSDRRGRVHHLG